MRIGFYGAAHEVTGSCTLLEVGEKKGIVDFGMEQGKDVFVNEALPVPYSGLDFVLLTHAHIRFMPVRRPALCARSCCATVPISRRQRQSGKTGRLSAAVQQKQSLSTPWRIRRGC